jgi:hypothetical protein
VIPCKDFIPAYSELFQFLENESGPEAVEDFWNYISDNFLGNLKDLVAQNGIRGCFLYWQKTLNEEAADFTLTLDEGAGTFQIEMHQCPSIGRLINEEHIEPYHDYCRHCDVLYRRVLEPLGYEYEIENDECHTHARCRISVRDKTKSSPSLRKSDDL